MSRQLATAVLSIANGQTKSTTIQNYWGSTNAGKVALDHAASISIRAPAALTGVATIQVAMTEPSVDGDFTALQSPPGTDLVIAAGKTISLPAVAVKDIRISSSLAEGAQRDFIVTIQEDIG